MIKRHVDAFIENYGKAVDHHKAGYDYLCRFFELLGVPAHEVERAATLAAAKIATVKTPVERPTNIEL